MSAVTEERAPVLGPVSDWRLRCTPPAGIDAYVVRAPGNWCYASWHPRNDAACIEDCAFLAGPCTPAWAATRAAIRAVEELGLAWAPDWCPAHVEAARALVEKLQQRISQAEIRIAHP